MNLRDLVGGKRFAVLGLGATGLATAQALSEAGADVVAWDDNNRPEAAGFAVQDLTELDITSFDALVMSPGIPHTHPAPHPVAAMAKAAGIPLIGDIELLMLSRPTGRFIGITGTNGKSTTTALTAHLLTSAGVNVSVGGNLGPAALSLADPGPSGWHVLELSSYQCELIEEARFDLAAFLNLTPDHLIRHGDFAGYAAAKWRLFERIKPNGHAAIAQDDDSGRDFARRLDAEQLLELLAPNKTNNLALAGDHNTQNAAVAAALVRAAGLTEQEIEKGLASFPGLAHRQELVPTDDGVLYLNDSKATNAEATEVALATFCPPDWSVHWIAGGQAKEGGIDSLAPYFDGIRCAYLIGTSAKEFATTLKGRCDIQLCETLDVAVVRACAAARTEKGHNGLARPVVLLSPACASWDQFDSFEQRGDQFKSLVLKND